MEQHADTGCPATGTMVMTPFGRGKVEGPAPAKIPAVWVYIDNPNEGCGGGARAVPIADLGKAAQALSKGQPAIRRDRELKAGTKLVSHFRNVDFEALVLEDGRIDYAGDVYNSLSAAARSITGYSINGWTFWREEMNEEKTA